jgi:uncharacterized protein (DUF58 family)
VTGWRPTAGLTRVVALGFVPLVAGLLSGRPDVLALAVPFVIGGALAAQRRPGARVTVRVAAPAGPLVERTEVPILFTVDNAGEQEQLAVMRFRPGPSLTVARRDSHVAVGVPARSRVPRPVAASLLRWGRPDVGSVQVTAYGADLLLESDTATARGPALTVVPEVGVFSADDAMPNAAGLVGVHRSRRTGDGGELAGVRAYGPGDRLRRIDWRTSLRTGDLHIAQTLSDRDAELVVLLDLLHEVAAPDGVHSILDTTVHAAAGIATHYLDRGDRVALQEFGASSRLLRAAGGRRRRVILLEWLLAVRPATSDFDVEALMRSWSRVPRSSLVVVLTPLLDDRSAAMAALLARGGRSVVAVDTLPAELAPSRTGRWADAAFRLGRLERANDIAQLAEHGVPTVRWDGAGSLDQVLRESSRRSGGARVGGTA